MHESTFVWHEGETWYRVYGELDGDAAQIPAVICHGGPGSCADYCEPIAELVAASGRACILYDQIGCGRSTRKPEAPPSYWTPELFLDELRELTHHFGIEDRYVVIGQSWGGMLAMQHALDQPAGLRSIVVCDSPASMTLWVEEADRLRADLPPDVQAELLRHETEGTTDSPAYEEAVQVFYDRHLCRVPWPACLTRSFERQAEDPTVYHTMNGPSEFFVIGSLKSWDITDRLHEISVPTLLVSGEHDEATPRIVGEIYARIRGARWAVFHESSHTPHLEEPEAYQAVVNAYLAEIDARG